MVSVLNLFVFCFFLYGLVCCLTIRLPSIHDRTSLPTSRSREKISSTFKCVTLVVHQLHRILVLFRKCWKTKLVEHTQTQTQTLSDSLGRVFTPQHRRCLPKSTYDIGAWTCQLPAQEAVLSHWFLLFISGWRSTWFLFVLLCDEEDLCASQPAACVWGFPAPCSNVHVWWTYRSCLWRRILGKYSGIVFCQSLGLNMLLFSDFCRPKMFLDKNHFVDSSKPV